MESSHPSRKEMMGSYPKSWRYESREKWVNHPKSHHRIHQTIVYLPIWMECLDGGFIFFFILGFQSHPICMVYLPAGYFTPISGVMASPLLITEDFWPHFRKKTSYDPSNNCIFTYINIGDFVWSKLLGKYSIYMDSMGNGTGICLRCEFLPLKWRLGFATRQDAWKKWTKDINPNGALTVI